MLAKTMIELSGVVFAIFSKKPGKPVSTFPFVSRARKAVRNKQPKMVYQSRNIKAEKKEILNSLFKGNFKFTLQRQNKPVQNLRHNQRQNKEIQSSNTLVLHFFKVNQSAENSTVSCWNFAFSGFAQFFNCKHQKLVSKMLSVRTFDSQLAQRLTIES